MYKLTLKIEDFRKISEIQEALSLGKPLSFDQKISLQNLLLEIPKPDKNLFSQLKEIGTPETSAFEIVLWELKEVGNHLNNWIRLFSNIPGWDCCPFAYIVDKENLNLLREGVVIVAVFSPSYLDNMEDRTFEIHLYTDGNAKFKMGDDLRFPELASFNGNWKDAYFLLIEILKKGWPILEFPKELKLLLGN